MSPGIGLILVDCFSRYFAKKNYFSKIPEVTLVQIQRCIQIDMKIDMKNNMKNVVQSCCQNHL